MNDFDFSTEAFMTNIESEKVVLGSIFAEPELLKDCTLAAENFGIIKHQLLFEVFKELERQDKPIDIGSVYEVAGNNRITKMGGVSALAELADYNASNFLYHQGVVLEHFINRKTREIGIYITQNAGSIEPSELFRIANEKYARLEESGGGGVEDGKQKHIKNVLLRTNEKMQQNQGEFAGATTGYHELDRLLSGMRKQDLIIIGARPSVGKTAFAVNVGIHYASSEPTKLQPEGGPVAVFSLEMGEEALSQRMLSNVGNINGQRIQNAQADFVGDDWVRNVRATGILSEKPFYIFDKPGADIGYIRNQLRWMRKTYPGQHVVAIIDYLQLITGDPKNKGNRQQEVSDISKGLKNLAREFDMTIIALSQLSRKVEDRADKRPMLSDLRESGSLEQDADVIGFLYREDYYDKETEAQNIIEVIIAKQRNGPVGTVSLAFVKEYSKFVNIGK